VLLGAALLGTAAAQEPPKLNEPTRPGVARPAELPKGGALQLEIGIDSRHDGDGFDSQQTVPVFLRYSTTDRLAVDLGFDAIDSQAPTGSDTRTTGFGDTTIGAQWLAVTQTSSRPAVAIAYTIKLPTAGQDLGTGAVDHRPELLVSKKAGGVDLNVVVAYLRVENDGGKRVSGASVAASASQEFANKVGYVIDVSYQSEDAEAPKGTFGLGALTYRLSDAARLDGGVRVGLSSGTPNISVIAGLSVGIPVAVH